MRNRLLIFSLISLGIVSLAELAVVVTTISPKQATPDVYWAFFLSLFGSLTVVLSFVWYILKSNLIHRTTHPSLASTIRQAALFSLIIVLSFFFNSLAILSLWDIIPLGISVILIEFFFQADKSPHTGSLSHGSS